MSNNLIGATLATFTVTLSAAVTEPVDVAWSTRDGTAKAGTHYEAANGVITFLPGETAKKVSVSVYAPKPTLTTDKSFYIELSPPSNAVLATTSIEVVISLNSEGGVSILELVVPQGKRGLKGDPGLSAYEHAVLSGRFVGTEQEWLDEELRAGKAAQQAEAAATSATIAGKVYLTPAEGVNPSTGVPVGAYFNVRSTANDSMVDEYKNVNGVATPTGKSYPSAHKLNQTVAETQQSLSQIEQSANQAIASTQIYRDQSMSFANQAEAAATAATIGAGVFDTPEAGVDPVTGVPNGAYYNVRSPDEDSYLIEYQNIGGIPTPSGKKYPTSKHNSMSDRDVAGAHPASAILDASGLSQQEINNARVVAVDSIADLLALSEGRRKEGLRYLVSSFYSDLSLDPVVFKYIPGYSRENHNGGTILDPSHTSAPGQPGWWESTNTGTGCFVMVNADSAPLNVMWFGARNDTDMYNPEYDSWWAFDAAFRTCFWDHKNSKVSVNTIRRVLTPTRVNGSYDGSIRTGFYVSQRITDETHGWPLTEPGVTWTSFDIARAELARGRVIIFDGVETPRGQNVPVGVMKSPTDFLYRFKWTVTEVYNLAITGNDVLRDKYPAILTNQKISGDKVFLRAISVEEGPYANLEGATVESGRVPYQIYPGVSDRVPGVFNIGIIVDNGPSGTNSDIDGGPIRSNCNISTITGINTVYCEGTPLFLSRGPGATADTNGCRFTFENTMSAKRAAILTINGGSSNSAYIQCAQTNFAAVHLTGSGAGPSRNEFSVGYMGDYAGGANRAPLLFIDDMTGGSLIDRNVLTTVGANMSGVHGRSDLARWLEIHPLSADRNGILKRNAVVANGLNQGGVASSTVQGFGSPVSLPFSRTLQGDFSSSSGMGEDLGNGAKRITYSLDDFVLGANMSESSDLYLKVDIWVFAQGESMARRAHSSWLCSQNVGNTPIYTKVAETISIAPASYSVGECTVVDGRLCWDIVAPTASTSRVLVLIQRAVA